MDELEPDVPNRIIHDQARASNTLRSLSDAAERAWWRLTLACDDYGRFEADPEVLLASLFKRRPAGWSLDKMRKVLGEWVAATLVHLYWDGAEGDYGHIVTWFASDTTPGQRRRDSKPKFPTPPCGDLPQVAAKCGESRLARARSESREPRAESREPRAESREPGSPPRVAATRGELTAAELVKLYNDQAPEECPSVVSMSPGRRGKLRELLEAFPDRPWWEEVCAQLHRSRFLRGHERPREGHSKPFIADLDWLLAKGKDGVENAVRVHDGRYRDG